MSAGASLVRLSVNWLWFHMSETRPNPIILEKWPPPFFHWIELWKSSARAVGHPRFSREISGRPKIAINNSEVSVELAPCYNQGFSNQGLTKKTKSSFTQYEQHDSSMFMGSLFETGNCLCDASPPYRPPFLQIVELPSLRGLLVGIF